MTDLHPEDTTTLDDEELVRRFRSGLEPERVFGILFRRYGALTLAFFSRRIGHAEIAAEQNQELYLSVIAALDGFRGDCSFRSWLFTLAHNRLGQWRRRLRVHTDEEAEEVGETLLETLHASERTQPEKAAVLAQQSRMLRRCVARLSETERVVVYGQYYAETTLRELTAMLRMENPSGARACLIKAQRKLRRCLEDAGLRRVAGGPS